jgi:general secretion pathway protein H
MAAPQKWPKERRLRAVNEHLIRFAHRLRGRAKARSTLRFCEAIFNASFFYKKRATQVVFQRPARARGFTLMELLVVLVIASLAISLVGPAFQRLLPGLTLEAESRKLAGLLRHARSQAILSGAPVAISQDAESGGLLLSYREQPYVLPERFSLTLEAGPGVSDAMGVTQILFYPRGDSSGGSLSLALDDGRSEAVSVDWLSGRVQRGLLEEAPPLPDEEQEQKQKKDRQQATGIGGRT